MLRSVLLTVAAASTTLASVVNVCAQGPFNQMKDFQDFEPAKAHCAPHFPAQTIVKRAPHKCLTTTKTVVVRTEHVTATRHEDCPTHRPEHYPHEPPHHHHHHHVPPPESMNPVPTGHHHRHDPDPYHHRRPEGYPHREPEMHHHREPEGYHHRRPEEYHRRPEEYHHHREERHYHYNRNAAAAPTPAPTPAPNAKRGAGEEEKTRIAEWKEYYNELVKCGYDCIQTACSCVAATKIEVRTPKPTCTRVSTKSTVIHETRTVVVRPKYCEKGYGHEPEPYHHHKEHEHHHKTPEHYHEEQHHHEKPEHYRGYHKE